MIVENINKDVKIYFGYNNQYTQKIYGFIDRIRFRRSSYANEQCILEGRSYEAKLYFRRLSNESHRSYSEKGAGEIVIDLMDTYLPTAESGITTENVIPGGLQDDVTQTENNTAKEIYQKNTEEILNWSFETNDPPSNWSYTSEGGTTSFTRSDQHTTDGSYTGRLYALANPDTNAGAYITQNVDFTNIDKLIFDVYLSGYSDGAAAAYVYIDSDLVWSKQLPGPAPPYSTPQEQPYNNVEIDCSSYTGTKTLKLRVWAKQSTLYSLAAFWDNFRTYRADQGSNIACGQTFTTGSDVQNISRIKFLVSKNNYTGSNPLTCKIYTDSSKGTLLGTATNAEIPPSKDWIDFHFNPIVAVTPNTQYYVELTPPLDARESPDGKILFYYQNTDVLSGGNFYTIEDETATSQSSYDAAIKTSFILNYIESISFAKNETVFDAVEKLSKYYDFDWYIDFNKDLNFFPKETKASNFLFNESDSIQSAEIQEDGFYIRNTIDVEGSGSVSYSTNDSSSQTIYNQRDLYVKDVSIDSNTYASGVAESLLADWKTTRKSGKITTVGLPELNVGEIIWVEIPNSSVNGEYTVAELRTTFVAPNIFESEITLNEVLPESWEYLDKLKKRTDVLEIY